MASHTSFGMAKHLSDILYNAVNKCITRDIGMKNKGNKRLHTPSLYLFLPCLTRSTYRLDAEPG